MSQTVQTVENTASHTACAHPVATTEDEPLFQKNKSKVPFIGIDLLGGDTSQTEHILETLHTLYREIADPFRLLLFVTPRIHRHLKHFCTLHTDAFPKSSLVYHVTEEVIYMKDDPLFSVRRKKDSSMRVALQLLKEKKIDALITTGNTGALIASTRIHLPMLDGMSHTALIALLPTKKSPIAVIDVGANIECTPKNLMQFAQMGLAYQKSRGLSHPRIGLLNIGTEEKKGRGEFRETYKLLQKLNISNKPSVFIGNVEGKEIFSGNIDVLVTDGFTGNVFLKTSEGISSFILETLHENQAMLPFSKTLLSHLKKELYSAEHSGAILCGIDGIIMKCHGNANPEVITNGAKEAIRLIDGHFLAKMKTHLKNV